MHLFRGIFFNLITFVLSGILENGTMLQNAAEENESNLEGLKLL